MPAAVVVCVVWFSAVIVVGVIALALVPRVAASPAAGGVGARFTEALEASMERIGRLGTALVFLMFGTLLTMGTGFLVGKLAHALQNSVDWPFFRWWESRQVTTWGGIEWAHVWRDLTGIGSTGLTQTMVVIGGLGLALLWRRRQWWAPPLVLVFAYVTEKYGQIWLKAVVDRGHPPTTLGTFPSGGCARVLCIYGLIIFLALRWWRPEGRRPWVAGGLLLALMLSIQAYARLYNLEHWFTDVVGGIIYGLMLLTLMMGLFEILVRERRTSSGVTEEGETFARKASRDPSVGHVVRRAGP